MLKRYGLHAECPGNDLIDCLTELHLLRAAFGDSRRYIVCLREDAA